MTTKTLGGIVCVLTLAATAAPAQQRRGVRYGPGVCGPIDPVYVKTSTETGGQPFPLSTAEIAQSSRVMEASLLPELLLWASGEREISYSIPVDPTITRMMIAGTFDGTGGSLALIAPDGSVAQQGGRIEDTTLNCGRILTIDAPASGLWQLRMIPTARFWLSAHAKSDVSLTAVEFVEQDASLGRLVRIQGEPIAGKPATLRVRVSSSMKSPTFQLVTLDGRSLQSVDLQASDAEEFMGTITLPAEPFRVLVNASVDSGGRAQRMWAGLFHGEVIEILPPAARTVTAGTEVAVTFRIRNHGPSVRLALVASDHRGRVIAVSPSKIDLPATAEGAATVILSVPADAGPGSEVSVRLAATDEDAAALGGFNGAAATFTVARQ